MKKKQAESLNVQTQSAILSKQVVQLILPLFPRKYLARIRSPGNFWAKVDKVSKMPTEATRGTKKKCLLVWPPRIHSGFFLYFLGLQERHDYISPMPGQAVLVCSFQYINTKAKRPMFISMATGSDFQSLQGRNLILSEFYLPFSFSSS